MTQVAEEIRSAAYHEVVVCDRSALDNYAYMVLACGRQKPLEPLVDHWMKSYDLLFKVPIRGAPPPTASATPTSSSCARSTSSWTSCSRSASSSTRGCRRASAASGRSFRPKKCCGYPLCVSACSDADALESRLPPDNFWRREWLTTTKPYVLPEENLAELT